VGDIGVSGAAHLAFVLDFSVGVSGCYLRDLIIGKIAVCQFEQFVDGRGIGNGIPSGVFGQLGSKIGSISWMS